MSTQLAKQLNTEVFKVIDSNALMGFERAFLIAEAAQQLQLLLTPEYMKPIMALQGNRLGFKTDKDDSGGYDERTVKNCLIEAVLTGVQPFGNQFNIIAGNCYITKEGMGHLLKNFSGLTDWEIIPGLPRINTDRTSAAIVMKVKWTFKGEQKERELDIPIRMNKFSGTDAVIGKATRKARAWLFNTISGIEVGDGDASETTDIPHTNIEVDQDAKKKERVALMINDCTSLAELNKLEANAEATQQMALFNQKKEAFLIKE